MIIINSGDPYPWLIFNRLCLLKLWAQLIPIECLHHTGWILLELFHYVLITTLVSMYCFYPQSKNNNNNI